MLRCCTIAVQQHSSRSELAGDIYTVQTNDQKAHDFLGFGFVLSAGFFFPNSACVCRCCPRLLCTACCRSGVLLKADCIESRPVFLR